MNKQNFRNETEMMQTAFKMMAKKVIEGQLIIFVEQEKNWTTERLLKWYGGTEGFSCIRNDEEAVNSRIYKIRRECRIFFLSPTYAHGYDLKIARLLHNGACI